jgi:mannose-6-phosphate isomerase
MKVTQVPKPWGYELILALTDRYAGKLLCINAGHRLSLQHHTVKDETLFLLDGQVEMEVEGERGGRVRFPMAVDESYRVRPGQRHRLKASSVSLVLEVSTPELEDVIRWDDDYGRADPDGRFAHEVSGAA